MSLGWWHALRRAAQADTESRVATLTQRQDALLARLQEFARLLDAIERSLGELDAKVSNEGVLQKKLEDVRQCSTSDVLTK